MGDVVGVAFNAYGLVRERGGDGVEGRDSLGAQVGRAGGKEPGFTQRDDEAIRRAADGDGGGGDLAGLCLACDGLLNFILDAGFRFGGGQRQDDGRGGAVAGRGCLLGEGRGCGYAGRRCRCG